MFYEHYRSVGNRYLTIGKEAELFSFPLHLHKSYELISVTKGHKKKPIEFIDRFLPLFIGKLPTKTEDKAHHTFIICFCPLQFRQF